MIYDKSFKEEAVRLSDEIGVKKASEQLGVPYYTLTLVFRYVFVYYNRLKVYTPNPGGLPPEAYRLAALRPAA